MVVALEIRKSPRLTEYKTEDILPSMKRALIGRFRLADNEATAVHRALSFKVGPAFKRVDPSADDMLTV